MSDSRENTQTSYTASVGIPGNIFAGEQHSQLSGVKVWWGDSGGEDPGGRLTHGSVERPMTSRDLNASTKFSWDKF